MVAGIVPAACKVESAVSVRIEVLLVLCDKFLTHVNADIRVRIVSISVSLGLTVITGTEALVFFKLIIGLALVYLRHRIHRNQRDLCILDMTVFTP